MKLTFLIPPVLDGKNPAERTAGCTRVVYLAPNIYELTVVALLEKEGFKEIAYRDFVYKRESREAFNDFLKGDNSDIYYIWSVNLSLDNDIMALKMIRAVHPDAYVIFMGPGPTYFTAKCLSGEKEIVVRGEPDLIVLELTKAIVNHDDWHSLAGISFLRDGVVEHNPARARIKILDERPFAGRPFLSDQRYLNTKLKLGPYKPAVTSRNCPFHCIYCVPSSLTFAREIEYRKEHGKKPFISFRSIESIDAEMAQISKEGYKAVGFMDDNFIWNEQRTRDICHIMKKYDLIWGCQARVDDITEEID